MITTNIYSNFNDVTFQNDSKETAYIEANSELRTSSSNVSSKVMSKIDLFLSMGSSTGLGVSDLSREEKEKYLKILAKLMSKGIIGHKYYKVNGKIEKHDLVASIGDSRLYGKEIVNQQHKIDKNI